MQSRIGAHAVASLPGSDLGIGVVMQTSHPTGITMYCQHHDRDDSNPQAAHGVTPAGMVEPGCSTTSATAGEASDSETRATGIQADHCHVGSQDHPDASGGEPEGHDSCYYPLTLSLEAWSRKPRRSFSEPDLLSATCESSYGSDIMMVEPPVVRRCETFTRHMLRQLDGQASDGLLPVVPASSCKMRVEAQVSRRVDVRGQKKKKGETLTPADSSFALKQHQKCRPSASSGCHHSLSVTGRRCGLHVLHHDAVTGSEAATNGCELDASLKINTGFSALRCCQAATMIGSSRHGPRPCSLQVNGATWATCQRSEGRRDNGRSLADVVALWEEFLTAAFN